MNAIIVFFSVGLLVYWIDRTILILRGSKERISAVLGRDARTLDDVILALRATFYPSTTSLPI